MPSHPAAIRRYGFFALGATGVFGAMMDVELVNDGPVTLILGERSDGVLE
jgi:D-Tyr-tRNAtyr deacylase